MVPLAIIGTGCLFPGAADFRAFWSRVVNRHDAIREVPPSHWDAADYLDPDPRAPDRVYAARGGFLDPVAFEPGLYGIPPIDLEATDASQLLGLVVADQALKDCGYAIAGRDRPASPRTIERTRISVILGVTGTLQLVIPLGARLGHPLWKRALAEAGVDRDTAADVVARIADGYVPWQENSFPGLLGNVVAGRIANRFDLGGTNCVVDAACASSLSAVHLAAMELATGRADYVLTGGVDAFNDIFMFTCFTKTPALSPTGNARPFDASGDGTVLGEGLGMVVLKRLDDARRDGDRILAVLRGIGTSSDGKGNAIYAPKKEGQVDALRDAYATAGVGPETIELVEAHGTGTRVGDAAEVSALAEVYGATGRVGPWCAVGSIKSQIGHTKAAAGVAGLLKAAAALHNKVIPPTIKVTKPLDVLQQPGGPLYVAAEKRPWMPSADHPRRAAVSAFGFGGSNFHAVLEEGDPVKREIDWTGDVEILAMAGPTWADVRKQLDAVPATLGWDELRQFAGRSRREWRGGTCRLLLTLSREGLDLARSLREAREALDSRPPSPRARGGKSDVSTGEGTPGPLAVLFPGQGAQYVGMMRDLVCHFPPAFDAFAAAGGRLVDVVYPVPAFTPEAKAAQEASLRATEVAQPALGAVGLGAWRVLESFGVRADAFAGHSYGELVALCAAGRLSEPALVSVSALRGRLMAAAGHGPGAMLAVKAGEADVSRVLAEHSLSLTLANKNTPTQTVLSGPASEIDRAAKAFAAEKVGHVRLEVAAAFHTPTMAAACAPLRAALDAEPMPPGRPVYANTTGGPYPDDAASARDLLANQLARPVEWVRQVEAMLAAGVRTFVEVGPGARLTGMVEAIANGRASTLALDASGGKASGFADLARCLAALAARGHPVRLDLWDPAPEAKPRKPGMTVQLTGANYTRPREPRPARVAPRPPTPAPEPIPARTIQTPTPMNQPKPTPAPAPSPPVDASALTRALELTRESLSALQRMQEQASSLHRQFLEGQDHAHQTVHLLVEQQHRLLQASLGVPAATPAAETPLVVQTAPQAQRLQPLGVAPAPTPVPAPPAPPVAAPPPAPAPVASSDHVRGVLLSVIAEKTGYPSEMLELGMTLDADLGIDSIKRVEILSALQDRLPDAPVVKPEHLGTLHTLADIASFLADGAAAEPAPAPSGDAAGVQQTLLSVIAEKTGYPSEMLELGMTLDADLGIDSIKRVEILSALQDRLPDAPVVKPEHLGTLHTLADIASFLAGGNAAPPPKPAPAPKPAAVPAKPTNGTHKPTAPPRAGPSLERSVVCAAPLLVERQEVKLAPGSEVWLSDDDPELSAAIAAGLGAAGLRVRRGPCAEIQAWRDAPAALIVAAPRGEVPDAFLADALMATKRAASGLRASKGVLLTVARMDGAFGLMGRPPARPPIDGGLAGLAKTAGREWPEVHARALDVAPDIGASQAAAFVVEELALTGPTEVGLTPKGRATLERVPEVVFPGTHTPFQPGEVVVVSGGARGVTAEVAVELAKAFRPTLVLLGRSPEPGDEPDWMAGLADEAAVKQALARRHPGTPPRALSDQTRDLLAAREVRDTLARIRAAGAEAVYRAVDVRDADQVRQAIADVTRSRGPVRGLIHGAGVLADAKIEDKTPEQFAAVYGTKVDGLRSLLAACGDGLRALVLFSSSTARFGRVAQVDYAIANEVLNKLAWQESARRPGCRVVSFGWGPWDGGMVTPGLKQLFLREGVGVIPLDAGARLVVDELRSAAEGPREVVVLGPSPSAQAPAPAGPHLPPELPLSFERTLDVDDYPVLTSHVIDGRPVLPVALMVEWFAHAAMVQNPGLVFHGCDDLRVLHGVSLEGSLTLRVGATKSSRVAGQFVSSTELRSRRPDGREILHARAEVVLTTSLPAPPAPAPPPILPDVEMSAEEVYRGLFHGPALQGIEGIDGIGEAGLTAGVRPAPPVNEWMHQPLRQTWLADPLVLDSSFQMMVLWTHEQRGAYSLPVRLGRYRQYRRNFPADGVRVVVTIGRAGDAQAGADIDYVDREGKLVARCEGYLCVLDPALTRAFGRNVLVSA